MSDIIKIYADGGSRGNPGPCASGAVLFNSNDQIIDEIGTYLDINTNNYAEYYSLITGLEKALEHNCQNIEIYMDSLLVVKQVSGEYKVKHPNLIPLFLKVLDLRKKFKNFSIYHIPREQNKIADKLVNRVLDERLSVK